MADRLFLSYWLRGFTAQNMLRHFERMLVLFPFSTQTAGGVVLRVHGVGFQEPSLLEQAFPAGATAEEIMAAAREMLHADCAYEVEAWWDLWEYDESWILKPSRVSLFCFGPEFEQVEGESLRAELGIDSYFLPQPDHPDSDRYVQSNLKGLIRLVHELDGALAAERRRLWTESGEEFASVLHDAV